MSTKHRRRPEPATQVNLGSQSRIAGGNYYEIMMTPLRMTILLATTPAEELAQLCEENEHFFRRRFGFHANHTMRIEVMRMVREYDLTVYEFSALRFAGQISVSRNGVYLTPTWIWAAVGWVYISIFVLAGLACFWVIGQDSSASSLRQDAGLAYILGWCGLFIWAINRAHIEPWRLAKKIPRASSHGL